MPSGPPCYLKRFVLPTQTGLVETAITVRVNSNAWRAAQAFLAWARRLLPPGGRAPPSSPFAACGEITLREAS